MKAIVAHAAKDLRIDTHEKPTPSSGQVLIQMQAGGICGSDLHYYNNGGFGSVRLKQPMILGHEVAGTVAALGPDVQGLSEGDLIAISASRPCYACRFCHEGKHNHCLDMRFYGSAMPYPHIQGAFSEFLVVDAIQCAPAQGLSAAEAAMAEPLAVALHAAKRAGDLMGKRVLVTGCGPIGLLVVMLARAAGAVQVVASDVTPFTVAMAKQVGADAAHHVGQDPDALQAYNADKGQFDVLFECSGVAAALANAIPAIRPEGIIVQLGLGGDMTLPVQAMTAKELELRGSFRWHAEFFTAVELMRNHRIDVKPLVTHSFTLSDAIEAFEMASDRTQAIKTQIAFA